MIYKVKAKFNYEKAKEFLGKLRDGSIANQQPDGPSIMKGMKNATIDSEGLVNWTELCYCPTPLFHERGTVYDKFFSDMETEEIGDHEIFEGKSFIEELEREVN